jgi:bifunctional non-homologous end joining protein LigD
VPRLTAWCARELIDTYRSSFADGRDRFGGGEGVRSLPLEARRAVLEGLLCWRDPVRMTAQMTGDGAVLVAEACRDGWEGLIAKRRGTPYVSTRSRDWLKLKCTRAAGDRDRRLHGAARRAHRPRRAARRTLRRRPLSLCRQGGTGFTRATLRELSDRFAPLVQTSPFDPTRAFRAPRRG